jgi:deoxyguanosine kinase
LIIAIEGGIGVGKTTTARLLAERINADLVLEQTDRHPFLSDFYQDPSRFAIETELGFVLLHYHQLHQLSADNVVVADFSPAKDVVFAQINLRGSALELFEYVYEHLSRKVPQPALAIYLDLDVNVALERIRLRDRSYERGLTSEYLEELNSSYSRLINQLARNVRRVSIGPSDSRETVAQKAFSAVYEAGVLR